MNQSESPEQQDVQFNVIVWAIENKLQVYFTNNRLNRNIEICGLKCARQGGELDNFVKLGPNLTHWL